MEENNKTTQKDQATEEATESSSTKATEDKSSSAPAEAEVAEEPVTQTAPNLKGAEEIKPAPKKTDQETKTIEESEIVETVPQTLEIPAEEKTLSPAASPTTNACPPVPQALAGGVAYANETEKETAEAETVKEETEPEAIV